MRSRSEYQEYRCASVTDSCENKMRADGSRGGRVFSGICLFVCLSVCLSGFPHDISKTAAARIAKLEIEMFHHESWKHFLGSKVKVARHKNSSGVGFALLHLPALLWLNYRHRFTLTVSKYCALNVMTDSLPPSGDCHMSSHCSFFADLWSAKNEQCEFIWQLICSHHHRPYKMHQQ